MSSRVVAIGERDQVRGFRSAGVDTVPVKKPDDAARALQESIRDPAVALILLTESLANQMGPALKQARARSAAAILIVPSHRGSHHTSLMEMKALIEQSIGVDMIGKIEQQREVRHE